MDLITLERECHLCRNCVLSETRHKVVFGAGPSDADVMLIGESPGSQEDLNGEPFIGPAGQFLDVMLSCIDLERSDVYLTNIVKCRPPQNRDPLSLEQSACAKWLEEQIALVDPKIIICLGRVAATALIDAEFKISREHGKWVNIDGRAYTAIYHPSALLRYPKHRPETFIDLKSIQARIRESCNSTSAAVSNGEY